MPETLAQRTDVKEAAPERPQALTAAAGEQEAAPEDLVLEELLVEDVSIDGMCGVY